MSKVTKICQIWPRWWNASGDKNSFFGIGNFLGYFEKLNFLVKSTVAIFRETRVILFYWAIPSLFFKNFVFSIQLTEKCPIYIFADDWIRTLTSGTGSDRSTDWATTTAPTRVILGLLIIPTSGHTVQNLNEQCIRLKWSSTLARKSKTDKRATLRWTRLARNDAVYSFIKWPHSNS